MLPNLTTLLVHRHGRVAPEFTNPESIGRTITRMSVIGNPIAFHLQQHKKLCMALKARNLQLIGDLSMCVAMRACNDPIPRHADLLREAKQNLSVSVGLALIV